MAVRECAERGCRPRSLPGRLLRYVVVRDPRGVYRPGYFVSTDTDLTEEQVIESDSCDG